MIVIPHPPYSCDLIPYNFFVFPNMKFWLKGCCFITVEDFRDAWIHEKTVGIIMYVPEGSITKETEETRS
jgi:hypothetical protein